jgi:hypothetical protein
MFEQLNETEAAKPGLTLQTPTFDIVELRRETARGSPAHSPATAPPSLGSRVGWSSHQRTMSCFTCYGRLVLDLDYVWKPM